MPAAIRSASRWVSTSSATRSHCRSRRPDPMAGPSSGRAADWRGAETIIQGPEHGRRIAVPFRPIEARPPGEEDLSHEVEDKLLRLLGGMNRREKPGNLTERTQLKDRVAANLFRFRGRVVGVGIRIRRFARDAMRLGQPLTEIDQLAALAAEGSPLRARVPRHGLAAGGTGNGGRRRCHDRPGCSQQQERRKLTS